MEIFWEFPDSIFAFRRAKAQKKAKTKPIRRITNKKVQMQ
jgi:hypothetical protein